MLTKTSTFKRNGKIAYSVEFKGFSVGQIEQVASRYWTARMFPGVVGAPTFRCETLAQAKNAAEQHVRANRPTADAYVARAKADLDLDRIGEDAATSMF